MTDQEKMRKLFDAALRAPEAPATIQPTVTNPPPAGTPADSQPAPAPAAAAVTPAGAPTPATPAANAGLDPATSAELGAMLDAQRLRLQQSHRRQLLVTAVVLLGCTGGGYAWFIQSPTP